MKKILIISAALFALVSCQSLKEEFQPVFTGKYQEPEHKAAVQMTANKTIADVAQAYKTNGKHIVKNNFVISGIVSTTDQPGNFYKSFYIQDETGGIEIKVGKNGLYNDYLPGQRIYVDCNGLSIGAYGSKTGSYGGNGMVQIGFNDPSGAYETSYLEIPMLIDKHILKGEIEGLVEPVVLSESDIPGKEDTQATNSNVGKLVTLKDLKYGGSEEDVFVLLYIDSNRNKKASDNRIFISAKQDKAQITTWAMSKEKMTEYLTSKIWDGFSIGNANDYNYGTVADLKDANGNYAIEKNAYSVSQYFHTPAGKEIQLRTSGYCKFADNEIPTEVLDGTKSVDITGILTLYQGSIQIVVNDINDIVVH